MRVEFVGVCFRIRLICSCSRPFPMLLFRMCNHRDDADAGCPRCAGNVNCAMAKVTRAQTSEHFTPLKFFPRGSFPTQRTSRVCFMSVCVAGSSYYMQVSGILKLIALLLLSLHV